MLETGALAPSFTRPGVVDGEIRPISLDETIDDSGVVLLAFYPADFSPMCTEELCSLRDIDLFSLQPDVRILGLSTDTAYSHRRFAREFDLGFPLVSDNDGSVAEMYNVLEETGLQGHHRLAQRALFVLDPDRVVRYAWAADEATEMPDLEAVRDAIEGISDEETALGRYRTAFEWYLEGRTAYHEGYDAFETKDWLTAENAFETASESLTDALEAFDAARRYTESERVAAIAEDANERATVRRNAAKWFARAATHYSRGEVDQGEDYRGDAERHHQSLTSGDEPPTAEDIEALADIEGA
ncbi:redoxin domain-containing protein [Halobacteria archaeon AArc-curdl1]|uniref:Redoxin domain-containing protein n=1 Tax=Natronosalvus hydrolyticus TaxID=2979988 RepID=A0AAP2ZA18_9EURY|nr:redoxin domain-containing protein [Halobacteria archaeon AArc-curdl1]